MTDARERYLRIQAELGGAEVILRKTGEVAASDGQVVSRSDGPTVSQSDSQPPKRDWRKDAPGIPGPGLTITSPASTDLLSGPPPFASLDEVALECDPFEEAGSFLTVRTRKVRTDGLRRRAREGRCAAAISA